METGETASERLSRLLLPLHAAARLTARRICRSPAEGDDLFHEAVLRALSRIDQLREESRFRAWFFAVLLSVHRARCRRAFLRRLVPFAFFGQSEDPRADDGRGDIPTLSSEPLDEETRTRAARITEALHTLSAEARQAIVLFEVQGFSIEEIAEMQDSTASAVKSRLSRARQSLRQHYLEQCQQEDGATDSPHTDGAAAAPTKRAAAAWLGPGDPGAVD